MENIRKFNSKSYLCDFRKFHFENFIAHRKHHYTIYLLVKSLNEGSGYLESVGHSVRSVTLEGEVILWILSISVLKKYWKFDNINFDSEGTLILTLVEMYKELRALFTVHRQN